MLPILMGTAVPFVIIVAIVIVLLPKGEGVPQYDYPTMVIINKPPRGRIYVSSTWGVTPEPERFKYQTQEDPADPNPIYDELEGFIRESEARMQAEINAAVKAHKILFELGEERRKQLQLV